MNRIFDTKGGCFYDPIMSDPESFEELIHDMVHRAKPDPWYPAAVRGTMLIMDQLRNIQKQIADLELQAEPFREFWATYGWAMENGGNPYDHPDVKKQMEDTRKWLLQGQQKQENP